MWSRILLILALLILSPVVLADNRIGVPGSNVTYPAKVEFTVSGKTVPMVLTGTAMRTRLFVNVYAIGSYVQAGSNVRTAEELARANCFRQLHLVMERAVTGKDFAEAFRTSLRANYPEPAFDEEVNTLVGYMRDLSVIKGEHITLTHQPGVGLHCFVPNKANFTIKNPRFSDAVWDIYLGPKNLGDAIKKGLVNQL